MRAVLRLSNFLFAILLPLLLSSSSFVFSEDNLGFYTEQQDKDITHMTTLGGVQDSNSEINNLARFAVDQHNHKQNALLELVRVVKAQEQVVAGTLHHLTLEVIDAGSKKLYEAKVWVKPWMNFKELQEFRHVGDVPCFTSSDLGARKENLGFCAEQQDKDITHMTTLGGVQDSNSEINSLARFAVDQHNDKQNALLELVRVVKAQEQVVAGTLHHLTLEVIDAGSKKLYEAKVWVKPWMNFKELQEFRHVGDVPCFTSSDLGARKDEQVSGWQSVAVHDPVIQDAAHHAVKTIQERSNSLLPYELSEIVHANAEVVETSAKFDMLLKVRRGGKEEKFKVEVHRNSDGGFRLNKMDSDHS
ncbi:hypothetical protein BUALT_Bualt06G0147600 [Buddleja alternifolia]|uniref:Cysteine proteinase inhibitor n=1 Tax=Buddleja alternifolia TaxID=168488 RepID=A0AAV6XFA7_9LAMI|nr:hypothetical protein BUALT_Bualt06G0147600 [Buddleja alternifolia]